MQLLLDLPEDISDTLRGQWGDVSQRALEVLAVEGYRSGALSEAQVRRMLGYESRFQVHALLKRHNVPYRLSTADVESDIATHRELGILTRQ